MVPNRDRNEIRKELQNIQFAKSETASVNQLIGNLTRSEIVSALLYISKQVQLYNYKGKTDGSMSRFFSNNLSLVIAGITGQAVNYSLHDLRNTLIELRHRWQQGNDILQRHRRSISKALQFQVSQLELLQNAAIAEQSDIRELLQNFEPVVEFYGPVIEDWNNWGLLSYYKRIRNSLSTINPVEFQGYHLQNTNVNWYQKSEYILKSIDALELLWDKLKEESNHLLNSFIKQQNLDPIASLAFITGDFISDIAQNEMPKIEESIAQFFLEKQAGIQGFELVPQEFYAQYLWNPDSETAALLTGQTFNLQTDPPTDEPLTALITENTALNNLQVLKQVKVNFEENISNFFSDNLINVSTQFPNKFKLERLSNQTKIVSPFKFQLKSTVLGVRGNLVKWSIAIHFKKERIYQILNNLFEENHELRQSFSNEKYPKIISQWVKNAFQINYESIERELHCIDENSINLEVEENSETLKLEWKTLLDSDVPTPVMDELGNITLFFRLIESHSFLYTFFAQNEIEFIEIESSVIDLQDFEVYNDYGKIDTSAPFNIFGTKPELGSKLYIGHPLLFTNSLSQLKLNWQWFGLPDSKDGFNEYYEAYDYIKNNQDFLVSVSALKNGIWHPEEDKQIIPLFANTIEDGVDTNAISNIRRLNEIEMNRLNLNISQKPYETLKEPTKSKHGYISFELVSPIGAFGHNKYNEELQRRMSNPKNAKAFFEPYTPSMGNLSIQATLSEKIHQKEIPNRLETSGISELILDLPPQKSVKIFPEESYKSAIYLQLGEISNNSIQLYFELPQGISGKKVNGEKIWNYFKSNESIWSNVPKEQIRRDETLNFENSGNILIDGLGDAETEQWYRIMSPQDNLLHQVKSIQPQIIKLALGNMPFLQKKHHISHIEIPEELAESLSEINLIHKQELLAINGVENRNELLSFQFKIQNKISSYEDLRNFLLVKFPKLQEVLILTHRDSNDFVKGGFVRIVVIPKTSSDLLLNGEWPMLSSKEIKTIQHFLNQSSPIGTRFIIENPVYEQLIVKCNIVIESGMDKQYARKLLHQAILEGMLKEAGILDTGFSFGKSIYSSKILVLLRSLPFIKAVTNFACYTRFEDFLRLPKEFNSLNYIVEPSNIHHILIPSVAHLLDIKESGKHNSDGIGVSNMALGTDFLVDRLENYSLYDGIGKLQVGLNMRLKKNDPSSKKNSIKLKL